MRPQPRRTGSSAHFKQHAVCGLYQKMRDRNREDLVALV